MYQITQIETVEELLHICNEDRARDDDTIFIGVGEIKISIDDDGFCDLHQPLKLNNDVPVIISEDIQLRDLITALAKRANMTIESNVSLTH